MKIVIVGGFWYHVECAASFIDAAMQLNIECHLILLCDSLGYAAYFSKLWPKLKRSSLMPILEPRDIVIRLSEDDPIVNNINFPNVQFYSILHVARFFSPRLKGIDSSKYITLSPYVKSDKNELFYNFPV